MNDMICPHCGKLVTPIEGNESDLGGLFDYAHFYCPKCGKEL